MPTYISQGSIDDMISEEVAFAELARVINHLNPQNKVLIIPPDITRFHSWAGELTVMAYQLLKDRVEVKVLPAIGTHRPMTSEEIERMYPGIPHDLFIDHHWRDDLVRLGTVPESFIHEVSGGKLNYSIHCEINKAIVEGDWDLILSIGQLVPHEVAGIANYNKNILIGSGGGETIHKTHYLSAVCGIENILGKIETPVRKVFDYMTDIFLKDLPIHYLLTVRGDDGSGELVTRGLYLGTNNECYLNGGQLCRDVNLNLLDHPLKKVVVYLDPEEFKSTWLGNKSIYRTRMAIADNGHLIVLAPGLEEFGEDAQIDSLIRKYGYLELESVLKAVNENDDLQQNLSAAAHLVQGASEGRFKITYCPGHLSEDDIRSVGYDYAELDKMIEKYNPEHLSYGFNQVDGEEIFFIPKPALGLWGLKD